MAGFPYLRLSIFLLFTGLTFSATHVEAQNAKWDTWGLSAIWDPVDRLDWEYNWGEYSSVEDVYSQAYSWCIQSADYVTPGTDCEPHPGFEDQYEYYDTGAAASSYWYVAINVYRNGGNHGVIKARWYPYHTDPSDCPTGQVIDFNGVNCIDPEYHAEPPPPPLVCSDSNPCNPADGSKRQIEIDYYPTVPVGISFARYYSSLGPYKSDKNMAAGWRHTYSRSLDDAPDIVPTIRAASPATQSASYSSASDACTQGWDDIKTATFSGDLSGATPTFIGGNSCVLEIGGNVVGYIPIRNRRGSFSGFTAPSTEKTLVRQDGSYIVFKQIAGNWEAPLNSAVSLVQSGSDWIYTDENDVQEKYDSSGRLRTITQRNGQVTTLTYSTSNPDLLTRVTGPFGHKIKFTYTGDRLTRAETPVGNFNYGYSASTPARNLTTVGTPGYKQIKYHYEDDDYPYHLTGITDQNNDRFATWSYDDEGRAISSEHAGSELVQYAYNTDGSTTETTAGGASRTYSFATAQGTSKLSMVTGDVCATCPGGLVADRTYDANGFPDETIDWELNTTQTVRNAEGLVTSLIEAKGSTEERTTTTTWHSTYRIPTQVVRPNHTIDYTHDAKGNVLTKTIASGAQSRTWTMTYNSKGQVLTINGPRTDVSDVTTFTYYGGLLHTVTNALGHKTTFEKFAFDAAGRPTYIYPANGGNIYLQYDWHGNVKSMAHTPTSGTKRTTTMTYDDIGQLKTLTTPDGMVLTYTYNAAHHLTRITDNLGNYIDYDHDAMGNVKDEDTYDPSNNLKRAVDYAYDVVERLDTITHGGHLTDLSFSVMGNLTSTNDPELATTSHSYDALNRLEQTIDALTGTIDYAYDDHDNLTSVTAANGANTAYEYDDLDNLTKEISPDRGTTTYTYDEAGNVKTKTDARGKVTTYTYDALNRLTLETLDGGATIAYEYDVGTNAKGHLTKITDASGTTEWTYNNFGEVTQKVQTIGTVALTTGYGYDTAGRLSTITYPSGKVVTYGYNTYLPVSVDVDGTTILSGATYDPFGPATGWTWGNSSSASRSFDLRGLPTSIDFAGDTQTLGYDNAGQVTSQVDSVLDLTYDYDLLGRLTNFDDNSGGGSLPASQVMSYDANGNRASLTENSILYSYSIQSNSNRLLSTAGPTAKTYTYDLAGNVINDAVHSYEYDDRGRLVTVDTGTTASYTHNGQGQRVKKDNGTVTLFAYDKMGGLLGEYDSLGVATQETVWFDGAPVAVLEGNNRYYVHSDHLGTPRVISEGNTIIWRWDSEGFGSIVPDEDPDGDMNAFTYNMRFAGQYFDSETNLYYNYFRTFDPSTGRYLESDPIGLTGGANTYSYVGSAPMNYVDPFGLDRLPPSYILDNPDYYHGPRGDFYDTTGRPRPEPRGGKTDFYVEIGGCMFGICPESRLGPDGSTAPEILAAPELVGGGFSFCMEVIAPESESCETDRNDSILDYIDETSFGMGRRLGLTLSPTKMCVNLGLGLGSPISPAGSLGEPPVFDPNQPLPDIP